MTENNGNIMNVGLKSEGYMADYEIIGKENTIMIQEA